MLLPPTWRSSVPGPRSKDEDLLMETRESGPRRNRRVGTTTLELRKPEDECYRVIYHYNCLDVLA